jgi:hypothetical protein
MQRWLTRLAGGFVVSAAGFSGFVYSQTDDGQRVAAQADAMRPVFRHAVDSAVVDGQVALETLWRTADAAISGGKSEERKTAAQLPFKIVSAGDQFAYDPYRHGTPAIEKAVSGALNSASEAGVRGMASPLSPHNGLPEVATPSIEQAMAAARAQGLIPSARTDNPVPAPNAGMQVADGARGTEAFDLHPVEARILARIAPEMRKYFDLYLYISKAEKGDWAQHMYVMAKQPDDRLALLHEWRVSTGKEEPILNPNGQMMDTDTPEGSFRLDRSRFHEDYTSRQWKSAMPYAMFFDWKIEGRTSGLAIHGTDSLGIADLGKRASHGCIRLTPENAKTLFSLITGNYEGKVPQLKIDPNTGTQSTAGLIRRNAEGRVLTKHGYRVLVVIENYGGPATDTVATIM